MNKSESITNLSAALLAAQKEMGNAVKGAANPFFKSRYADLNSVREAIMPALHKQGVAVLQIPMGNGISTTLLHESGEYLSSFIDVVCAKPNDPQAYGSAITYARRYALQSMLCIGAEDDDGEKAVDRVGSSQAVPKAAKKARKASEVLAEDEF